MNYNYPLFLPSVINTYTDFESELKNSEERLKQTKDAIYAIIEKNYFKEIVIVDGSLSEILSKDEIFNINKTYNVVIEQINFQQDKCLVEKFGKGNGEMQITNYMIDNSKLVKEAGGFVKLTPRYFFDNFKEIMPVLQSKKNAFFYYYPPIVRKLKPFVMTILYKVSVDFYNKNLRDSISDHNKSIGGYAESVFYNKISKLKHNRLKVIYPYFSGVSGTTGKGIRNQYVFFRNLFSLAGFLCYSFEDK